ncbi:MAG: radical SAM family heme chaperone HemW [Muribaculaceae bacterium]|nr:radical SAM family heme chaperone HemW [Muribaculaceae bacterium]
MAGIYVHVPFCHSKCYYCDFYSLASTSRVDAYVAALEREWEARQGELGSEPVTTLYFGGGTPSILQPELFSRLAGLFPAEDVVEFTIEVNPEDVSAAAADEWMKAGVNRVSIGVQSLDDGELRAVGRRHTAEKALEAINILHRTGIANVSGDLIYGLPGQSVESWRRSVGAILDSDITHLSAYCLSFEPGTRLYRLREKGEVFEQADEVLEQMYGVLCSEARLAGMEHYEISNFARAGYISRHNSSYWDGTPYLGLGPGAHSLGADGVRRFVPSNLNRWLANPADAFVVDEETATDRINDMILISLRTARGLNLENFGQDVATRISQAAGPHLSAGNLVIKDRTRLVVPESRWLLCDSVIRDLFISD